jgi:hypothetical protein
MNQALSFSAGFALAALNLAGLAFFVSRLGLLAGPLALAGYSVLVVLKFGLTLAALFFILRAPWFKPFSLMAGLGLPVAGLFLRQAAGFRFRTR